MSDIAGPRANFLDVLARIASDGNGAEDLTANLRAALLAFASETPDNRNAADRIEVGGVGSEIGVKLTGRRRLLSDIAHAVEDLPMPEALKTSFPDMSERDWDAFTRLTTLIYMLLGRNSKAEA